MSSGLYMALLSERHCGNACAQALFRPAQLKALVDIHAAEEGLPEGYLTPGVCASPQPCPCLRSACCHTLAG